ncbi:ATP synthase F1 subunit gamma [Candidatus Avelusimicrobium gallicola]|uniref:ATP synthase gamma chain n=1 Tax=Candidatus Avelusimicrobium gallicola TaxID=2562704 RepID=A0A1Y4DG88_9BACT|nr:ATP synthase F1 subunit gamma [Elusimicrobium sp. An273]OUO57662.1 ATP synthase F1 subunit gamma [Elusimicrobium sp. An273]
MESLRDIRQNIKAIKSTQQIMQTMKMISSARIRRAQEAMEAARPFAKKMLEMVDDLKQDILAMPQPDEGESWEGRFFVNKTGDPRKIGLLVITGDKGLAGSFNAVILRSVLQFLKANKDKEIFVFAVGKKGRDFLARLKMPQLHLAYESVGIFPKVSYAHAELLGEAVLKTFFEQKLGSVTLIYNDFKSLASQNLVEQKILPFDFEAITKDREESDFLFEPGMLEIFKLLVPRLFKANMYRFLLESQAANLAATMNAMDAASKNAGELVTALGVKLNKVRQAGITNEILDIVNGAEALNS